MFKSSARSSIAAFAVLLAACGSSTETSAPATSTSHGTLSENPPFRIASLDAATFTAQLDGTATGAQLGTVGADYHISGNWHAYASYSISRIKTNLVADTAGVIRTTHISFGPQALIVSVGYSF
jgi:hypothetical protein